MILKKNYKRPEIDMKKIGMVHGVFDVIHIGHIKYFQEAKKHCDYLIASVTADKFVNKAPHLPINNHNSRAKFLSHLKFIDYIYINNHETSENVIKNLKPKIYFKGSDYKKKDITGNLKKEIKTLKINNGKFFITNVPLMS